MRKSRNIVKVVLSVFCLLIACKRKSPNANFTSDKDKYVAGDTVRLRNFSDDAESYNWLLPNGSNNNETNINYALDRSIDGEEETFVLEAFSKNKKKSSEKKVTVTIIPYSWFYDKDYNMTDISCGVSGSSWNIDASNDGSRTDLGLCCTSRWAMCKIILTGNTPPNIPGKYFAKITITAHPDEFDFVKYISNDSIVITFRNNGKLRVVFDNINATYYPNKNDTLHFQPSHISGDITCP